ncbi:hypothetical protein ACFXKD_26735 [Nocardiopsis aegyptia]|uniref:hypothetical protein n=1 Tax=Nocardiopsis aegyptia TaxID=220378 RepID=UPI0036702BAD
MPELPRLRWSRADSAVTHVLLVRAIAGTGLHEPTTLERFLLVAPALLAVVAAPAEVFRRGTRLRADVEGLV